MNQCSNPTSYFCQCEQCLELYAAMDLNSRLNELLDFRHRVFNGIDMTNFKSDVQKFYQAYPLHEKDFYKILSERISDVLKDKESFIQNRSVIDILNKFDRYRGSLTVPNRLEYLSALLTAFMNRKGYRKISHYSAIGDVKYAYQCCKMEIERYSNHSMHNS
ncbi:hypothetical protein [Vibrio furnissii]|uniref:hypothetical protein n=1 Tax=Vibrio furnissii TaxID=29494 RepID=UPI001EEB071E|nr:hypothetical protein [Vibrio furnissii]